MRPDQHVEVIPHVQEDHRRFGQIADVEGIALAGGFTERAAPNRTKIIRTHRDGRQETLIVDLNEVIKRGRKDKDVSLTANDVIVVPESFF